MYIYAYINPNPNIFISIYVWVGVLICHYNGMCVAECREEEVEAEEMEKEMR